MDLVSLGLAWALGLYSASSRTIRFVAIAGATTAAWTLALVSGAPTNVRFAILLVLLIAVIQPRLLGAAAVTTHEKEADVLIENLVATDISSTTSRVELLERVRDVVPNDAGRLVAARLRLWAAARRYDALVVASMTSADEFERTGTSFLREAQWHRVLGSRPKVTPWDEDVALRGFHEDSTNLIPQDVYGQKPPIEVGAWVGAVETLLSDLAVAPFRDAATQEARMRLIEAIRATLVTALGDRSDSAKDRQARAAGAMSEAWRGVATRLAQLSATSDIRRR